MIKKSSSNTVKQSHEASDPGETLLYQIRIVGQLDEEWTDWFSGFSVSYEGKKFTKLTGPVIDQAALFGLLKKIRDLGLQLISVNRIESSISDLSTKKSDHKK